MTIFLQEAVDALLESGDDSKGIIDTAMENFLSYTEKKLKGYSTREIDSLARKAKSINSEVKKRETLRAIEDSIKTAQETLNHSKTDEEDRKELRMQLQVLRELKTKVNSFKVVDSEEHKEHVKRDRINLDEM